ncbi:hypothetical protein PIB30_028904 [Stylosanthes scabra]|uniref:Replication protein A 70 kDa DNA-binding subunit B/D first OB fold domain-containing protein n=1 Tax=Stylosanthes scabra TaxID=79078 RepID=A0ABU6Z8U5_9FABA|nr:hypothetical protein [Stylosanthes scabra]
MALATDFLEDVGSKKLDWCFNVYLIRFWEEPDKNNEEKINSIDMVIQDIKSTRVQGSIPDSLFKQWRGKLEEFKMYTMSNFIVADRAVNWIGPIGPWPHKKGAKQEKAL